MTRRAWHSSSPSVRYRPNQSSSTGSDRASASGPRQRIGGDRYAGREGVIVKTQFAGFYVKLDMTPRERSQKTELVDTAYLEVLAPPAAA